MSKNSYSLGAGNQARQHFLQRLWLLPVIILVLACATPQLAWPSGEEPAPGEGQPPLEPPPGEGQPPGEAQITFTADRTSLSPGECATLQWSVQGGFGVTLNGQPVEKSGQQQVCPGETTPYRLGVDTGKTVEERMVTIVVEGTDQPQPPTPAGPPPQPPQLTFTFSPKSGPAGSDVKLQLSASVQVTVYYNGQKLPTKVSSDGKTLTVTIPAGASSGYFELKWDSQSVKASEPFTVITIAQLISADLKITDLFPKSLPVGRVYMRITNGGPDDLTNAQVGLACVKSLVGQHRAPPSPTMITISVKAHQTIEYDTGIDIDTSKGTYTVTCTITYMFDPNSSNNTYSENIP